jgi:hypothetical protein
MWTIGVRIPVGLGTFLFDAVSRPALGSTQPPSQWVPGALSLGIMRPGREADHSPPSSAEVKECAELYLHSPIRLQAWCLVKHRGVTFYKSSCPSAWLSTTPRRRILCLIKQHDMKTYWGNGSIAPHILNLGTGWKSVVSFTPRPHYRRGRNPWYALDRRLGVPHRRWQTEKFPSLPLPGIDPRSSSP